MKFIWEENDFSGDSTLHGVVVFREKNPREKFIISWQNRGTDLFLVSTDDGMIFGNKDTPFEFADMLNANQYVPLIKTIKAHEINK